MFCHICEKTVSLRMDTHRFRKNSIERVQNSGPLLVSESAIEGPNCTLSCIPCWVSDVDTCGLLGVELVVKPHIHRVHCMPTTTHNTSRIPIILWEIYIFSPN